MMRALAVLALSIAFWKAMFCESMVLMISLVNTNCTKNGDKIGI